MRSGKSIALYVGTFDKSLPLYLIDRWSVNRRFRIQKNKKEVISLEDVENGIQ